MRGILARGRFFGGEEKGRAAEGLLSKLEVISPRLAEIVEASKNQPADMAKQFGLVREIKLVGNFYEAEGFPFKFSRYYYKKLGIPIKPGKAPPLASHFIAAEEVFRTATAITKGSKPVFSRYFTE